MELQKGRPENTDNRLDKEIRVYDFLDKLGVQYQRIDHEAAMTMEACEELMTFWMNSRFLIGVLTTMPPPRSMPAMTWMSGWTLRSAKICSCAIVRRRIFIFF